jgi:menaquinone-specific isochorismate synthase
MTVTPIRPQISDAKAIYDCLAACCGSAAQAATIVSLSLPLPKLDPLMALEQLGHLDAAHFYWEHPTEEIAIAAMQPVAELKFDGPSRFAAAQQFVSTVLQRTVVVGETSLPLAGPHFFCGFTFFEQPYHEAQRFPAATVFLPQWQVACVRGQGVFVANLIVDSTQLQQLSDLAWQTFQSLQRRWSAPPATTLLTLPVPSAVGHQGRFMKSAQAILEQIRQGRLEKLVLAETLDVVTTAPLQRFAMLNKLRSRYADCQTFSIQTEQGQGFIGASPERLLQVQDRWLTADALAGSAPRGRTVAEDALLGQRLLESTKDIHEHQVVLAFIRSRLQQLGVRPQLTSPAHLLQLPNIQHLRTLVNAELPKSLPLLAVLAALHPTPAVAGTPQERTEKYLQDYEPFDRHLYAAPLGWIDHRGNGHFTVGIRSAFVQGNHLRLYAGAGIVAGSDPHKEWAEVQLKLQTLLQALMTDKIRSVSP